MKIDKNRTPSIDYSFVEATIHFRPWKGKISTLKFYHDESRNIDDVLDEWVEDFRKRGEHKRRTIIGVSIFKNKHINI